MQTNIIINLQVEGLHSWPDATKIEPIVGFLDLIHRHIFHIECKKKVNHDNRDIEFIKFKREVKSYLEEKFYSKPFDCLLFESMSCEMIAKKLLEKFDLEYCKVLEDNENGAEIIK